MTGGKVVRRALSLAILWLAFNYLPAALVADAFDYSFVQNAIKAGRMPYAKKALDTRLIIAPADGYAHLLMGIVLSELHDGAGAESQFREAIRLRPLDPAPRTNLGNLLASLGQLTEASKQFEAASALNPRDATALSNLGSVQMSLKQYQPALKSFEAASKIARRDIPTLLGLFQAQLKSGLPGPAKETASRLLLLPGIDEEAVQIVGALQADAGDYKDAVATFRQGLQVFPRSGSLQFNLGLALQKSGKAAQAVAVLEALQSKQDTAELEDVLGGVYEQNGQFLNAVKSYQKAAEMELNNESYRFDYASELLAHRNFEAARLVAERSVNDFPESVRMSVALGVSLFGLERLGEAQTQFLQTARRFPDSELPLIYLSLCAEVSGKALPEGSALLTAFYEKHPKQYMAPYLLGTAALKEEDPAAAAKLLEASINLRADYAPSHLALGRALVELDKANEAVDQYRSALKLDPNNTEIWYRLTLAYRKLRQAKLADEAEEKFRKLGANTGNPDVVKTFLYSTGPNSTAK